MPQVGRPNCSAGYRHFGYALAVAAHVSDRSRSHSTPIANSCRFDPRPQEAAGGVLLEQSCLLDVALHGTVVAPAALLLDVAELGTGAVDAGGQQLLKALATSIDQVDATSRHDTIDHFRSFCAMMPTDYADSRKFVGGAARPS